jgi:hypothetical protein
MKKIICILAGAALLGACEKKTEVVAPAGTSSTPTQAEMAARGEKPKRSKVAQVPSLTTAATPEKADNPAEAMTAATPDSASEAKMEDSGESTPEP